ncbi:MAG: GNAT family N-acetyltransferase, partial [Planctomycetaceae bacterium]|nr:GNAT family N-acetyltransferase [Planctomycetaceae bacterium]
TGLTLINENFQGTARSGSNRRGDSANAGSIALHRRFGFELAGTLHSVSFKFGRWVDTPILQRALGPTAG